MGAPTIVWSESNGASPTITDNITTGIVFANTDAASTTGLAASNPVTAGNISYEKWWRLKVTVTASNSISATGVFFSSTAPLDSGSNAGVLTYKYGTNGTYATPVNTASSVATTNITGDTSAPGTSFTAPANTTNAYSAYITVQLSTSGSALGGNVIYPSPFMTAQYSYS